MYSIRLGTKLATLVGDAVRNHGAEAGKAPSASLLSVRSVSWLACFRFSFVAR